MANTRIVTSLIILVVVVQIDAQFFDFFSDLRPFTYQTIRPVLAFQAGTTKKPKFTNQRHDGESTREPTFNREGNIQNTRGKARQKTTTTTPAYEILFQDTSKNRRKNTTKNGYNNDNYDNNGNYNNNNGNYNNNNGNYNNDSGNYDSNNGDSNKNYNNNNGNYDNNNRNNYDYNKRPWQDANVIDYTTRRYETTRNNKYTTYNPLYNRPGVRPALVDNNRPPITNRPATQRPLAVFPRPTDSSVIRFPEGADTSPPVLTGPDEDTMTPAEKRKYIQIAENMCDKYKSLSVKKIEAIPLLPSPDSIQTSYTECEVSSVPLVVGGNVSSIREFPHMALLGWTRLKDGGYSWKCGGSLVSDRYVLTAAHCSYQNRDNEVVSGAPRVVQLGSSYLDDTGALVIKVASVVRHPKYSQSRSYYDIAMVKLVKPVTFSAVVKPACLGTPPSVGEKVVATGWGRTEFGGPQSLELRSVSVPVWDMQDCRRILGITRKLPQGPSSESQICAGEPRGGRDTCQGDSGGPAQIQDGCLWRIVAVTSVGRSCGAPNTPALYATVHPAFIAAQIFADQVNKIDNYDSNNQNSRNNERNFGSNFDNGRQNYDSNYNNNNRQSNNYDRQQSTFNNANSNKQTGINYDGNNRNQNGYYNQDANDRGNYNNQNVNRPSTTSSYYVNNDRQNNNYDSHNNGMINFNRQNYNTNRPSTSNYFANSRQDNNRNNNYYRQRDNYRAADGSEDIIYWPEEK